MSITYTPSTNFGAKDSLPTNDSNKVIRGSEFTTEFVAIQTAFSNAAPAASPTFTGTVTISSVDINGGTIDGVTIGGSSAGAGSFTTITASDDVNFDSGTFFVDASADAVGIGTSSPKTTLNLSANNSGQGPILTLENSDTSITTNDVLGQIDFYGNDGSTGGSGQKATIKALAENSSGTSVGLSFGTSPFPDTTATERMRIDANGNVGIGTDSPAHSLSLEQNNKLGWVSTVGSDKAAIEFSGSDDSLRFYNNTGSTERMRITASGNVGIGTSAPGRKFTLILNDTTAYNSASFESSSLGNYVRNTDTTIGSYVGMHFAVGNNSDAAIAAVRNADGEATLTFGTRGAGSGAIIERMRIDSSGNLLVGGTTAEAATSTTIYQSGQIVSRVDGTYATEFRRDTSDGDISVFKRGTTTVGSIGTNSDGDFCFTGASNVGIGFQGNAFVPLNGSSARTDNAKDVGAASVRFDDIYATNAIIQTSDRNEKQDIEELTEAERRVAVAAKGLLRKFRWISSVEEKGDEARIHFGIIAQDLQAAFEAEGLDAGRYAMFIHSTWTDEETGEERSRMGVRYSELLAFIIAAL